MHAMGDEEEQVVGIVLPAHTDDAGCRQPQEHHTWAFYVAERKRDGLPRHWAGGCGCVAGWMGAEGEGGVVVVGGDAAWCNGRGDGMDVSWGSEGEMYVV